VAGTWWSIKPLKSFESFQPLSPSALDFSLDLTLDEVIADLTYPRGRRPALGEEGEEAAQRAAMRFLRPRRAARPPDEAALLATGAPLDLPDGLAGTRWGSGPPVLLVHGWEGWGTQLKAFVAPLVRLGCSVIAFDGPAHGDTPGVQTSPRVFRDAIRAVGEQAGPLRAVIAHSAGGLGALLAVGSGLRTERLVLLAAPSSYSASLDLLAMAAHLPAALAPRMREIVEEHVGVPVDSLDRALRAAPGDLPGLVIHDPGDPEVPYTAAESLVRHWPGATVRPVPGLGHRSGLLTDPGVVTDVAMFVMGGPG
jgi:pimeloyl-ACP methyl ester carboxylesterase